MDGDLTDDWGGVGWTNCPRCLVALELDGTPDDPCLICPTCGMLRLTA